MTPPKSELGGALLLSLCVLMPVLVVAEILFGIAWAMWLVSR